MLFNLLKFFGVLCVSLFECISLLQKEVLINTRSQIQSLPFKDALCLWNENIIMAILLSARPPEILRLNPSHTSEISITCCVSPPPSIGSKLQVSVYWSWELCVGFVYCCHSYSVLFTSCDNVSNRYSWILEFCESEQLSSVIYWCQTSDLKYIYLKDSFILFFPLFLL